MSDPIDPPPASPAEPSVPAASAPEGAVPQPGPESTGLPANIAACLACIPLVGGIAFLVLEKRNKLIRFYAMQSVILGGGALVLSVVLEICIAILAHIPLLGWLLAMLIGLAMLLAGLVLLVVWIVTLANAFNSKEWEIPYVGKIAREQLAKQTPTAS